LNIKTKDCVETSITRDEIFWVLCLPLQKTAAPHFVTQTPVKKCLAGLNSPSDQINTVDDKTVELDAIEQLAHLQ
jgi:hypothetical protein